MKKINHILETAFNKDIDLL